MPVEGEEISHAVLSAGRKVKAAGEIDLSIFGGKRFVSQINNHSGHFQPSQQSLSFGISVFRRNGIEIDPSVIISR